MRCRRRGFAKSFSREDDWVSSSAACNERRFKNVSQSKVLRAVTGSEATASARQFRHLTFRSYSFYCHSCGGILSGSHASIAVELLMISQIRSLVKHVCSEAWCRTVCDWVGSGTPGRRVCVSGMLRVCCLPLLLSGSCRCTRTSSCVLPFWASLPGVLRCPWCSLVSASTSLQFWMINRVCGVSAVWPACG